MWLFCHWLALYLILWMITFLDRLNRWLLVYWRHFLELESGLWNILKEEREIYNVESNFFQKGSNPYSLKYRWSLRVSIEKWAKQIKNNERKCFGMLRLSNSSFAFRAIDEQQVDFFSSFLLRKWQPSSEWLFYLFAFMWRVCKVCFFLRERTG